MGVGDLHARIYRKYFLMDTDSAVIPSAFSSVLSSVSLFSCLKYPAEIFRLGKVGQTKKELKNRALQMANARFIFIDVASSVSITFNENVFAERSDIFFRCSS